MTTLSEIKSEHKHALQIVENLSSKLATDNLSNEERNTTIEDLNKWKIIQTYVLNTYKEHKVF